MDQSLGNDDLSFAESIVECETGFEEAITILKPQGLPISAGPAGTIIAPKFDSFESTAVLEDDQVAASIFAGGVMSAGDIVLQMRDLLQVSDGPVGQGGTPGDRIVWRGAQYRLVQRSKPVKFGATDVFYHALLRRVNSPQDQVNA